jgi:hypothetical protein
MRFGRVQEAEIQTTARLGRQSVMQYRFAVMSVGRPLELIGLRRIWRGAHPNRCADGFGTQRILSHDESI